MWDKTIGDFSTSARVTPLSILVNKSNGDFYVAGTFGGTVDFDPNAPTVNETSSSGFFEDAFIAKYDSSMNLIWVNAYVGEIAFGNYSLDFAGNDIVAVGKLKGTIDFGNGIVMPSPSSSQFSPFHIKLNNTGLAINGYVLNGSGGYNTINCINSQAFVTSGFINGSVDMDPGSASLILTATTSSFFDAVYGFVPTALHEITESKNMFAYPNPANDILFIESKTNEAAKLFDVNGQEVLSKNMIANTKNNFDVSKITAGLYILKAGNSFQKINIVH